MTSFMGAWYDRPRRKKANEVHRARELLRMIEAEAGNENQRRTDCTTKHIKIANTAEEYLRQVGLVLTNVGYVVGCPG